MNCSGIVITVIVIVAIVFIILMPCLLCKRNNCYVEKGGLSKICGGDAVSLHKYIERDDTVNLVDLININVTNKNIGMRIEAFNELSDKIKQKEIMPTKEEMDYIMDAFLLNNRHMNIINDDYILSFIALFYTYLLVTKQSVNNGLINEENKENKENKENEENKKAKEVCAFLSNVFNLIQYFINYGDYFRSFNYGVIGIINLIIRNNMFNARNTNYLKTTMNTIMPTYYGQYGFDKYYYNNSSIQLTTKAMDVLSADIKYNITGIIDENENIHEKYKKLISLILSLPKMPNIPYLLAILKINDENKINALKLTTSLMIMIESDYNNIVLDY